MLQNTCSDRGSQPCFAFPRLIGGIWLRFLATQTQTANLEELPCGAAVCMAPMWDERAC